MLETKVHIEGLTASTPHSLPFAPSLSVRAFALERDAGNAVIYSVDGLASDPAIAGVGEIARQYLNHGHEAMFADDPLAAPLFVHEGDRRAVSETLHVRGGFTKRHALDDDLEVIPTPGHTPGATAYLWQTGGHRLLFTGDTVYLDDGEWVAAVLGSSDREAYIESLELIRELDFDVLVPWAATQDQPWFDVVDDAEKRRRIGAILDRVRRGEDR
jgi:hypothetical protein